MSEIDSIVLGPIPEVVSFIIKHFLPNAPAAVKQAIANYALGNPGVAQALAQRAGNFTTAGEVEALVGWPLSEHNFERTDEIWNRFRR